MLEAVMLFGLMFVLMFIGVPVIFSIIVSCAGYLLVSGLQPLILVPQRVMVGLDSFPMLAAPLFILAGELMAGSSISKRLVDAIGAVFGRMRGGMGVVTIVACTIFAALTGSGPATVAAIGAIMLPALIKEGHTPSDAAGMISAGGALGPIIPPSICMIIYACTMNQSIIYMFAGSIIPGLMMAAGLLVVNFIMVNRNKSLTVVAEKLPLKEILRLQIRSLPVLALPVVVLGSIYGGIATPTEAAVLACVYSAILGFAYKDLNFKKLLKIIKASAAQSAVLSIILGAASIFSWILSATRLPAKIATAIVAVLHSQTVYLLVFFVLLMFVGCIMSNIPSIVILGPILVPVGVALGLDPLHLGIVFCINLIIGFVTPPFGNNLFAAVATTKQSYTSVVKGQWPYLIAEVIVVGILTFSPQITLLLPKLMYGYGG